MIDYKVIFKHLPGGTKKIIKSCQDSVYPLHISLRHQCLCCYSNACLCYNRDHQNHGSSQDSVLVHSMELASEQDTWRSLSCLTDSTEQSAPVNFIMSNRVSCSL